MSLDHNPFIHTRTLLNYVFTTFSKTRKSSFHSSNNGSNGLPTSLSSLSLNIKRTSTSSTSGSGVVVDESEGEEDDSTTASSNAVTDDETEDDRMDSVIDLLEDSSIDEEDKPELLKELLSSLLIAPDSEPLKLDPLILQLLHRHIEDLNPSGNPVPPLPTYSSLTNSSNRPSVSRSSSFRRNLTPTMSPVHPPASLSNALSSSVSSTSTRSTPGSPFFDPSSPPNAVNAKLYLSPNSNSNTPSHSPWSSPRFAPLTIGGGSGSGGERLSANALEFKLSSGASEFRPGSSGSGMNSPGGTSTNGRNSIVNAQAAQANWAFTSSPLGTPKYAAPPSLSGAGGGGGNSAASSPGYFPRVLSGGGGGITSINRGMIKKTRLPWAEAGESTDDDDGDHEGEGEGYENGNGNGNGNGNEEEEVLQDYPRIDQAEWDQSSRGMENGAGAAWDPFSSTSSRGEGETNPYYYQYAEESGQTPNYEIPPSFDSAGNPLSYSHSSSSDFDPNSSAYDYIEPGLGGGVGAYSMTPFDVLYSVFGDSDVTAAVLEEALVMSGWEIDAAIEYIVNNTQASGGATREERLQMGGFGEGDYDQHGEGRQTYYQPDYDALPISTPPVVQSRTAAANGSRPLIVSRDSFDGFTGGNGGRGVGGNQLTGLSQQWQQSRSGLSSPSLNQSNNDNNGGGGGGIGASDPTGRGVGGRVCRYYLSGNCLRSDCKFSHDVGKAVCKFWLRGHCLKGEGGRCDFLHSIPPIMRADYEAKRQLRNQVPMSYEEEQQLLEQRYLEEGPDLDFPTLGSAISGRQMNNNQSSSNGRSILDPTRSRFAGAVKFGRTIPVAQQTLLANLPRPPPPPSSLRDSLPQPRHSARLHLRPPALLPSLPTGAALAALYTRYRSSFLELGANRNKCLARAAECWKKGDGAGAKAFSKEAQTWNRQVAIEGRDSANRIVEERKKLMKDALSRNENRSGSTEDGPDRKVKGQEKAGGVILGVASPAVLPRGERSLTSEERTEVAMDLHGLHSDEAVSFIGDFLLGLERERFLGLAFLVIGKASHSGGMDPGGAGAAAGRLRLEQACCEFLSNQGWPWQNFTGILAVDAIR